MPAEKQRLRECAAYFLEKRDLERLLAALRAKIRSYGHLGATVTLKNCSPGELNAIGGLLGKVCSSPTVRIQIQNLREALDRSKFTGVELEELLEQIYGEKLVSRREEQINRKKTQEALVEQVQGKHAGTPGERWLGRAFAEHSWGYTMLLEVLTENGDQALDLMEGMMEAVNALPVWSGEMQYLPVFAAQCTGDPHAFDGDQRQGKLLLRAIHCLLEDQAGGHRQVELYVAAGLEPDPLTSSTAVLGLRLWQKESEHPAFRAFADQGEPCLVTMANLQGVTSAGNIEGPVFIVENQGVFSALVESALASGVALVCTAGQPRVSSWKLLELLCAREQAIYYCGDYDPEGLLIAQKVVERTAGRAVLWGYTEENYAHALSDVTLSDKRLAMLDQLHLSQLTTAGKWLRQHRRAAYQELLLDRMKDFLRAGCR